LPNFIEGATYTEKGSKFLGFCVNVHSVEEFKTFYKEIQKLHKKASHYCYAYILDESPPLLAGSGDLPVHKEKYTNDGEPGGVGSAMLNLLRMGKHDNCAVVVVRYFGGVLLGSGNLIRAYATATKNVLQLIKN
jgi:putative IMPACT (imprinted ancient) family translation regulator